MIHYKHKCDLDLWLGKKQEMQTNLNDRSASTDHMFECGAFSSSYRLFIGIDGTPQALLEVDMK